MPCSKDFNLRHGAIYSENINMTITGRTFILPDWFAINIVQAEMTGTALHTMCTICIQTLWNLCLGIVDVIWPSSEISQKNCLFPKDNWWFVLKLESLPPSSGGSWSSIDADTFCLWQMDWRWRPAAASCLITSSQYCFCVSGFSCHLIASFLWIIKTCTTASTIW